MTEVTPDPPEDTFKLSNRKVTISTVAFLIGYMASLSIIYPWLESLQPGFQLLAVIGFILAMLMLTVVIVSVAYRIELRQEQKRREGSNVVTPS